MNREIPQRLQWIKLYEDTSDAGLVCRRCGISKPTLRKWWQRVGIDPGTASSRMNHYEKGRHMPDYDTLERMAKELGVSVAYFFCQTESATELVKLIESMSEEQRKALLETIKHQQNEAATEQC